MPIAAQQQRGSSTTASAGIVGNPFTSDRPRRRRGASPELHQQLHDLDAQPALRRRRRGRRAPARFDDEDETGQ